MGHIILSVDVGGTKTDILLIKESEGRATIGTGEGTNPNIYGTEALNKLMSLIEAFLQKVNIDTNNIKSITIGLAGISKKTFREEIESWIGENFPNGKSYLLPDVQMAHYAIWGKKAGITLAVGTGSMAFAIDQNGHIYRAGGLGYQIGDEGSGYWLGKRILTELIANERSDSEEVNSLQNMLLKKTNATNLEEMLQNLSNRSDHIVQVASLASDILRSAEQGNFLAQKTTEEGAEFLADLVKKVAIESGLANQHLKVGISGSVIMNSEFYRRQIEEFLLIDYKQIEWIPCNPFPAFGGLIVSGLIDSPEQFSNYQIVRV